MRKCKKSKSSMLEIIQKSRPRSEVCLRLTTSEDKTKYRRTREKQSLQKKLSL